MTETQFVPRVDFQIRGEFIMLGENGLRLYQLQGGLVCLEGKSIKTIKRVVKAYLSCALIRQGEALILCTFGGFGRIHPRRSCPANEET